MTITEKIKEEFAVFEKKRVDLTETLRKEFPVLFAPLFAAHPEVKSFGWNQYTPYFNDGDECTFSANTGYIYINGKDIDGYGNDEDETESVEIDSSIYEEFQAVLEEIPDTFYRDLFGDHVKVTVLNDGTVETEEYDHD